MKFSTQYVWEYKVKGYTIFKEPLEIEVEVEVKNKIWWITKIGFFVKCISGAGYVKIDLDEDDDLYHMIRDDIGKDKKFNQSVLNETI